MKFLFNSQEALSMDIAFRMSRMPGDHVKFFIGNKEVKEVGEGIVDKVDDFDHWIPWADVVVNDDAMNGARMDKIRKTGKLVFGGSAWSDRIENDRIFGIETAKSAGLNVPMYTEFKNLKDVIPFIKKNERSWVLKPCGQEDRAFTFVGKRDDGVDMIEYIQSAIEKSKEVGGHKFILQDKIEGTEIGVSGYFDGKKFSHMKQCNFEHKKLLNDDLGPNTGETGTVLWHRPSDQKIFTLTLDRMAGVLRENDYRGWIDIELMVDEKGAIWFIEYTARWGYPQSLIMLSAQHTPPGQTIYEVASGNLQEWDVSGAFCVGVVVYSEGFPFYEAYKDRGKYRQVKGVSEDNIEDVHFDEVMIRDGKLLATGEQGRSLVVTSNNHILENSIKDCYNSIKSISIPSMGYRTDIGATSGERYDKLADMGLITPRPRVIYPHSIAVDLDKTLAHHDHGIEGIGRPIPAMMDRVKKWLKDGEIVKIFTARAVTPSQVPKVKAWLKQNGLPPLEVTNIKDPGMDEFWDDKAVRVEENTGKPSAYGVEAKN